MIKEIARILKGEDARKIILVGPCSADDSTATLDYLQRLRKVQDKTSEVFLFIPRVYTGKPRSDSLEYKGMLHKEASDDDDDNICQGIEAARKLHLRAISETDFYCADEMLYPGLAPYFSDLIVYYTVGARSVENQEHRLVASGLDMPVGMKNPTNGNLDAMYSAIEAAQNRHHIFIQGWECVTNGNPCAHGILRGYSTSLGNEVPNYYIENLYEIESYYDTNKVPNNGIIVDCSHANSRKKYIEQIRISKEVFGWCKKYRNIGNLVRGIMIESYIQDGNQDVGTHVYGRSVTDACLGWEKTERLLLELADLMSA